MINPFKQGDTKHFERKVTEMDTAVFDAGAVHPVLATFALGRDAEWVCRLFVLEMKETEEEGIGTFLEIKHQSPAFVNDIVTYTGIFEELQGNNILCSFNAHVGERLIATGKTGQKILKKDKINQLFNQLRGEGY